MQVKNELLSRRIILISSIFILVLIVTIGLILIKKKNTSSTGLITAIPADASLIIQVNDYHNLQKSLFEKNEVWSRLKMLPTFNDMNRTITFLDSVAAKNPSFSEILYNGRIYISAHFVGGRKSDFLYILEQQSGKGIRYVIDLLEEISGELIGKSERKYEGKGIYTIHSGQGGNKAYFLTIIDGNILFSKSLILIESAIRQYSLPKSLLNEPGFSSMISTAGKNKDANIFVNMHEFTGILSVLANDEFRNKLKSYKNFAGWMEFDLNVAEKQLMLNGFVQSVELQNSFIDLFKDNSPIVISSDKILPSSVSTFFSFGVTDIQKLYRQYLSYTKETGTFDKRSASLVEIEKKYSVKAEEIFLSFIDNEITAAHGIISDISNNQTSDYVLIKCKSGSQAEKIMHNMVGQIAGKSGKTFSDLTSVYTIDNDTKFSMTQLPLENLTGILFGNIFSISGTSFYTFLGNYLVVGNSQEALKEFLYSNVLSKTLSTNEAYKAFNGSIAQKSYFLAYTNLSRANSHFASYLHENIIQAWEEHFDVFQIMQPLGLQLTQVSSMYYANLALQLLNEYNDKPQTIWESLLDTTIRSKPQLVENHYNKQNEIFLQDEANTIYLINKAGRIIWKQSISEPINSKIYQVDYFKNGKLQLMFSSENYLHLIDRNGNYVERYPVRLRSRATAGMALFDYDSNLDYRIFIPCEDLKTYAYKIDGTIISGWEFKGSDYPVQEPVEHFRSGDKDYLIFGDKYATYILDRKGQTRVAADRIIQKSGNGYYFEDNGDIAKSRFITTDTAGNVVSIFLNGNTSIENLNPATSGHFFDFKDINADGIKDYIYLDGNELKVIEQDQNQIYNFSFPNNISQPPIFFSFSSSDRKLGIVDASDRKIYLINNNGQLYKGFPLDGSTLFSIGYLESVAGQFNLIVGGRNNFLYNYSVQ